MRYLNSLRWERLYRDQRSFLVQDLVIRNVSVPLLKKSLQARKQQKSSNRSMMRSKGSRQVAEKNFTRQSRQRGEEARLLTGEYRITCNLKVTKHYGLFCITNSGQIALITDKWRGMLSFNETRHHPSHGTSRNRVPIANELVLCVLKRSSAYDICTNCSDRYSLVFDATSIELEVSKNYTELLPPIITIP